MEHQLGFVITKFFGQSNTKFIKGWFQFLNHIGPNIFIVNGLEMCNFQDPGDKIYQCAALLSSLGNFMLALN